MNLSTKAPVYRTFGQTTLEHIYDAFGSRKWLFWLLSACLALALMGSGLVFGFVGLPCSTAGLQNALSKANADLGLLSCALYEAETNTAGIVVGCKGQPQEYTLDMAAFLADPEAVASIRHACLPVVSGTRRGFQHTYTITPTAKGLLQLLGGSLPPDALNAKAALTIQIFHRPLFARLCNGVQLSARYTLPGEDGSPVLMVAESY